MPKAFQFLITCEHAGNKVPAPYKKLFAGKSAVLNSHRGYDLKALETAKFLSSALATPLYYSLVTRLLVDVNRSPHHRGLFSEYTRGLGRAEKEQILQRFYRPHRSEVESEIRRQLAAGRRIVHLAVHSFTSEFKGKVRRADIGLLYDPARAREKAFCSHWQKGIRRLAGQTVVRRNYPYLGKTDGLITFLRKRFPGKDYIGIELELNQGLLTGPRRLSRELRQALLDSLITTAAALDS